MNLAQRRFTVVHITIHILGQLIKFIYVYEQETHSHKILITIFLKASEQEFQGKTKNYRHGQF